MSNTRCRAVRSVVCGAVRAPDLIVTGAPDRWPRRKGDNGDVPSQSVKRVVSGVLTAGVVIAAVSVPVTTATAAPTPALQQPSDDTSDTLAKYQDLAGKAEKQNQKYLGAKEDLEDTQDALDEANDTVDDAQDDLEQAKDKKERYRDKVDEIADASFSSGAELSKMSVLLSGDSTKDFIERSAALDEISGQKMKTLDNLADSVDEAESAKKRAKKGRSDASDAKDKAVSQLKDIKKRKSKLDDKLADVKDAADDLTSTDKSEQQDTGDSAPDVDAPGDAAQKAVDAALDQRGTPYEWGGSSPGGFDCSGLIQWSYKQAGVDLPRTADSQAETGQSVSRGDLEPGDIVYFYSPVSHDGIYIGDGKMVHAPDSGSVVRVQDVMDNGYQGATRVG